MEEKKLIMIEQGDNVTYFKLDNSQYNLLLYLAIHGYLDKNVYVDCEAKINIVEI